MLARVCTIASQVGHTDSNQSIRCRRGLSGTVEQHIRPGQAGIGIDRRPAPYKANRSASSNWSIPQLELGGACLLAAIFTHYLDAGSGARRVTRTVEDSTQRCRATCRFDRLCVGHREAVRRRRCARRRLRRDRRRRPRCTGRGRADTDRRPHRHRQPDRERPSRKRRRRPRWTHGQEERPGARRIRSLRRARANSGTMLQAVDAPAGLRRVHHPHPAHPCTSRRRSTSFGARR
jgi:hypothetical protein